MFYATLILGHIVSTFRRFYEHFHTFILMPQRFFFIINFGHLLHKMVHSKSEVKEFYARDGKIAFFAKAINKS